jgi:hypothetical protein
MTVVNESGLYNVILRSDKPEAKAFKRWVTHEVLPSIRRNGYYAAGREQEDLTTTNLLLNSMIKAFNDIESRLVSLESMFVALNSRNYELLEAAKRGQLGSPEPPFTKMRGYLISRSFDKSAQKFIADHINPDGGCRAKKRVWEALQDLAEESGWKIGSQSSFYRVYDTLAELLGLNGGRFERRYG